MKCSLHRLFACILPPPTPMSPPTNVPSQHCLLASSLLPHFSLPTNVVFQNWLPLPSLLWHLWPPTNVHCLPNKNCSLAPSHLLLHLFPPEQFYLPKIVRLHPPTFSQTCPLPNNFTSQKLFDFTLPPPP